MNMLYYEVVDVEAEVPWWEMIQYLASVHFDKEDAIVRVECQRLINDQPY